MDATNQITENRWKSTIFFVVFLVLRPVNAQAQSGWTKNDSVQLSKMLNGEISIRIDDGLKRELEQSIIGFPVKDDNKRWNDFVLDVDLKNDFSKLSKSVDYNILYYKGIRRSKSLMNGSPRLKKLMINSRTDKNLPLIKIQQNTNITIPLNKKLHFSVYGSYILEKKRSVILPATSIPYKVGAGFSYEIGKYTSIKSQTNYQYNIIQKRWEWFFGAGVSFTF